MKHLLDENINETEIDGEIFCYDFTVPDLYVYNENSSKCEYRGSASYWKKSDPSYHDMVHYFVSHDELTKTWRIVELLIQEKELKKKEQKLRGTKCHD